MCQIIVIIMAAVVSFSFDTVALLVCKCILQIKFDTVSDTSAIVSEI